MASNAPLDEGRRFRARPLNIHEPLSIVECTTQLRKQQPELYQWLQSEDAKRGDPVHVLNEEGEVVRAVPWKTPPKKKIEIPSWTSLEEESSMSLPLDEPPLRRQLAPIMSEAAYLADDDDIEWIEGKKMNVVQFEGVVTRLEHLHYRQLRGRYTTKAENGRMIVTLPVDQDILPKKEAVKEINFHLLDLIYDYWIQKRRRTQKPLLDVYWNAFPWSAILDRSRKKGSEKKDRPQELEIPFVGALKQKPPTSTKIPLTEQLHRLKCIRQDLEAARTLADRVRRREKLKKRRDELFLEEIEHEVTSLISLPNGNSDDRGRHIGSLTADRRPPKRNPEEANSRGAKKQDTLSLFQDQTQKSETIQLLGMRHKSGNKNGVTKGRKLQPFDRDRKSNDKGSPLHRPSESIGKKRKSRLGSTDQNYRRRLRSQKRRYPRSRTTERNGI